MFNDPRFAGQRDKEMPQSTERAMLVAKSALNDATTFLLRSLAEPQNSLHHHINWGTGVISGAVTVECADSAAYAGTWAPIAVVTFSGTAPKQDYVYSPGMPRCIRHRVSTVLAGGTVTTSLVGEG